MAYANAFELFLEHGNDHYSKIFDKQMGRLNECRQDGERTKHHSERDQLHNEGQHHSKHFGTWACIQAAEASGARRSAGHCQLPGNRAEV
eukprot:15284094-Heterocapsa_arctica.AAC.1